MVCPSFRIGVNLKIEVLRCVHGLRNHGIKNLGSTFARVKKRKFGESTGGSLGIKYNDGEWMGGGWGADEASLRARGGRILRGSVDALER